MDGLFDEMAQLNKTYVGYKPKDDNITKLASYLRIKNVNSTKSNVSRTTPNNQQNILKNKRF